MLRGSVLLAHQDLEKDLITKVISQYLDEQSNQRKGLIHKQKKRKKGGMN
jgi:hypothetical protein